jgi:CheY-like chemotaxis protein
VKLIWRESGGPVVRTPTRRSFGTTILEQAIPLDLNGEVHLRFPATGFEFEATLPAAVVTCAAPGNTETIALGSKAAAGPPAALDGLLHHCLLVEDNLFIAMDAEDTLRQIGAKHIVIARTVAQALDLVEQEKFTFALLDVNLGNETSLPVARVLRAKNILCALGTGYGDKMVICDALADIPVIAKPYHRAVMLQVLGGLAEKFRGGAEHG